MHICSFRQEITINHKAIRKYFKKIGEDKIMRCVVIIMISEIVGIWIGKIVEKKGIKRLFGVSSFLYLNYSLYPITDELRCKIVFILV